jgi:integrase
LMACFQASVRSTDRLDFHFHDFRYTFATRLREANVHPYDIADLLGHSVPEGETRSTRDDTRMESLRDSAMWSTVWR